MKLSDLIEEGARLIPKQGFRAVFRSSGLPHEEPYACCALGAALYAVFGMAAVKRSNDNFACLDSLNKALKSAGEPGLFQQVIHPAARVPLVLGTIVQDLNDSERWTREKIAGWLRTIGY